MDFRLQNLLVIKNRITEGRKVPYIYVGIYEVSTVWTVNLKITLYYSFHPTVVTRE